MNETIFLSFVHKDTKQPIANRVCRVVSRTIRVNLEFAVFRPQRRRTFQNRGRNPESRGRDARRCRFAVARRTWRFRRVGDRNENDVEKIHYQTTNKNKHIMTNFEFENALNQIIKGAESRNDKQTVVWAKVIQAGWRRCKSGTQKRAFRREAERQFKKHLVPVQEVADTVGTEPANGEQSTE